MRHLTQRFAVRCATPDSMLHCALCSSRMADKYKPWFMLSLTRARRRPIARMCRSNSWAKPLQDLLQGRLKRGRCFPPQGEPQYWAMLPPAGGAAQRLNGRVAPPACGGSQTAACKRYKRDAEGEEWPRPHFPCPSRHQREPPISTILPRVFLVRCAAAAVAAVAVSSGGPGGSPVLTPVFLVGSIAAAAAEAARAVPTSGLPPPGTPAQCVSARCCWVVA